MRHLILEEPFSRPARWSPKLAWFALVVTVMAVLLIRFGRIDYQAGFAALGSGLALALIAAGMALIGFVRIWQEAAGASAARCGASSSPAWSWPIRHGSPSRR